jgi:hypothetical protein
MYQYDENGLLVKKLKMFAEGEEEYGEGLPNKLIITYDSYDQSNRSLYGVISSEGTDQCNGWFVEYTYNDTELYVEAYYSGTGDCDFSYQRTQHDSHGNITELAYNVAPTEKYTILATETVCSE